jgi:RNA polymerase sigma factor (sigma-70 family)
MADSDSFLDVAMRLRSGDADAAAEIYSRYVGRLMGLVHQRLHRVLGRKVDPEDVAQSVFNSFFQRYAQGRFQLDDWNDLAALLVEITKRKCSGKLDYFFADCRDVRRERPTEPGSSVDSLRLWEGLAREPTPEEVATASDLTEQILGRLTEERDRQIVGLILEGFAAPEIAARLDCHERTVYRVQQRVRKWLREYQATGLADSEMKGDRHEQRP